jgi:SAM-dependent methyltransferase
MHTSSMNRIMKDVRKKKAARRIGRSKTGGGARGGSLLFARMAEREYILGTHDAEIARLELQHAAWRPHVLEAWRTAGLGAGHVVLDVGCGPGHATRDLSDVVGAGGRVVAIDQSRRFLNYLERRAREDARTNIEMCLRDLGRDDLPAVEADAAWCRWILAFVGDPRALLERIAARLRPGGTIVIHEYLNYATWRMLPPLVELDAFVVAVMASWRASGGEPDVGVHVPRWLEDLEFTVESARPLLHVARPGDPMWQWPAAFLDAGTERLAALGQMPSQDAAAIRRAFARAAATSGIRMSTPAVLQVIARRQPVRQSRPSKGGGA